ncbi:hypothetical protein LX87_03050 [Larkinella arboricola]|uniref:WG repeat protein n=1 Tax=Larkinella arboricola TaxID=643671 RepID=A0A327WXR5_LARAB|nr:hypothetical protein [Larkinella arboricola]RAJ98142.1 hypothetical protein LX87_03050 [Larkinella arboricola]
MKYKTLRIILFLLLPASTVFGQHASRDSLFREQAVRYAHNRYVGSTMDQARIYNGAEYVGHSPRIKGHPYLDSLWQVGSITYDGVVYDSIRILHDLVNDVVVVPHLDSVYRVQLQSIKVSRFSIPNHTVVRIVRDTAVNNGLRTGFYDQLYNGRLKVLARRTKTIQTNFVQNTAKEEYLSQNNYYIGKNGVYYPVKSKRSVFNVLADQKRSLRKYLRENRIKFSKNRETAIVKLTQQYDASSR